METVKVDTQKLQLLNDRIAQTIDALNQLKMSVHGIQHSPVSPYYGSPYYQSYPSPAPFAPQFSPFAQPFVPPYAAAPGFLGPAGIQHTATLSPVRAWTTLPPTYGQTIPAYAQTLATYPQTLGQTFGNGISHTEWDPTFTRQTWPTTQWPFPLS